MTSAPETPAPTWRPLVLLLGLALLAWWPLLTSRPAVADDYLIGPIIGKGLGEYWKVFGIWRLAGHPLPLWLRQVLPYGDAALALLVHLTAVTLFYQLLRRLVTSPSLQMGAALIFSVMPFGFQALTWNSALSFALSTVFALAALLLSLRPLESWGGTFKIGCLVGLFALLSISANEASLLLIAWVALYQLILGGWPLPDRRRWSIAVVIVMCEVAWVVVHLATRQAYFHKHVAFHVATVLAGLLRQYEQLSYLRNLPRLGIWFDTAAAISTAAAGLLLAGLWSHRAIFRSRLSKPQIVAFAILPLAAVAVYALGGGFSLDARKAYLIWAFLLLTAAWFLQAAPPAAQHGAFYLALALAPAFVFSSHVTTRVWQQTASAFEIASTEINEMHLPGPYAFRWQPDAYAAWPDFEKLCGFRFDDRWMMDYPIMEGALRPGPAQTTLEWQPSTSTWKVVAP